MLDWIFGSDKEKKKEEKSAKDYELEEEQKWVYDYLRQYLTSPIWRNPIVDFIQEHCVSFEDAEENKFQYTKIYQEFTGLVTMLIQSVVEETGISQKTLEKCILKGMRNQRDRKIFQQILLCDNFLAFKKIMITKNKQLELEALRKMQSDDPNNVQDVQINTKQLQRLEIEKAIAISRAMEEKAIAQQQKEMEEALRQSAISAKQDQEKRAKEVKKQEPKEEPKQQSKLSSLGSLPPLVMGTKKEYKPIEDFQKDQENLRKQIAELKSKQTQNKEGAEDRKKRLQEQRQMIRKKKQEERQTELNNFVQNKQADKTQHKVTEEELERRRNLMKKLKEQLKD